jgi:catechol 2,3-dioxygenase-like lactoylglutathione lyase family enzyme
MSADGAVLAAHHTSFTVRSLDATLPFLTEVLRLPLLSRAPRDPSVIAAVTGVPGAAVEIAYLGLPGGHRLELVEYTAPADRGAARPRPCDTGFAHLALLVTGIEALIAAASPFGVHAIAPPVVNGGQGPIAGAKVAYLRDADGITYELIEVRAP